MTDTETPMAEGPMTVHWVTYAGRRTATKGLLHLYIEEDGSAMYTKKPLLPGRAIGDVVEVRRPGDNPGQYFVSGPDAPRVVSHDSDNPDVLKWQVADRAAYQNQRDEAMYRRMARESDPLEEHIGALAAVARNMSSYEKAAFGRYLSDRMRSV